MPGHAEMQEGMWQGKQGKTSAFQMSSQLCVRWVPFIIHTMSFLCGLLSDLQWEETHYSERIIQNYLNWEYYTIILKDVSYKMIGNPSNKSWHISTYEIQEWYKYKELLRWYFFKTVMKDWSVADTVVQMRVCR
jgi:hypothetical protein